MTAKQIYDLPDKEIDYSKLKKGNPRKVTNIEYFLKALIILATLPVSLPFYWILSIIRGVKKMNKLSEIDEMYHAGKLSHEDWYYMKRFYENN